MKNFEMNRLESTSSLHLKDSNDIRFVNDQGEE